uniref:Uncharacterized protein n=1 Tax=Oryza punctata TaxID=4537 RepID=A0A0E0KWI3_ORYPU
MVSFFGARPMDSMCGRCSLGASAALGDEADGLLDSSAGPGASAGPAGLSAGASEANNTLEVAVTVEASASGATTMAARKIMTRTSARAMADAAAGAHASAALGDAVDALLESSAGPGASAGPARLSAGASEANNTLEAAVTVEASATGATAMAVRRITTRTSARAMADAAAGAQVCAFGLAIDVMVTCVSYLTIKETRINSLNTINDLFDKATNQWQCGQSLPLRTIAHA